MITYDFVPFHYAIEDIINLVPEHNDDVQDYGLADVNWEYFIEAGKCGMCYVMLAKDNDKTVGYAVFSVARNPMHKNKIESANDALFVKREYRGKIGGEMIDKSKIHLKKLGVMSVSYLIKNDKIGKLLQRKGFQSDHKLWSFEL